MLSKCSRWVYYTQPSGRASLETGPERADALKKMLGRLLDKPICQSQLLTAVETEMKAAKTELIVILSIRFGHH